MTLYRLTVKGTLPGEQFNFGIHANGDADDAVGAAAALAAAVTAMWGDVTDGLIGHYSSDTHIVPAHAAQLDSLTGKQVDAAESALDLDGTATGAMLPHEVAVAITTRAALRNKKDQGRFYLPAPSVETVEDGLLTATVRGHFAHAAAIMINSLQGAAFVPCIKHPDLSTDDIVTVECGDVFDCQRRRRNKLIEVRTSVSV